MKTPVLLADIGGTNARVTIFDPNRGIGAVHHYCVADFIDPETMFAQHRHAHDDARGARCAAIAAAGPRHGDRIALTNAGWTVDSRTLRDALSMDDVLLINDGAALAWALDGLRTDDCVQIGSGEVTPDWPRAIVAPGTGLAVAGYVPTAAGGAVIVGEGGHVSLPAIDAEEMQIVSVLRDAFGHVSAERALSGMGLVNLRRSLAKIRGLTIDDLSAGEIGAHAFAKSCDLCRTTFDVFFRLLGTVAGDVALTLGARGGMYIGGGIVPRYVPQLQASAFRDRFEDKGRFKDYLAPVATFAIRHPNPILIGLATAVQRLPLARK